MQNNDKCFLVLIIYASFLCFLFTFYRKQKIIALRILAGEKYAQINLQSLEKVRLGCWYFKSIIYKRFLNWNKTFKK